MRVCFGLTERFVGSEAFLISDTTTKLADCGLLRYCRLVEAELETHDRSGLDGFMMWLEMGSGKRTSSIDKAQQQTSPSEPHS